MPRTKEQFEEMRERTSETIISSALKLFAEKGFNGTSINDIAKMAKISKGLIYNYFESKKEIAQAIYKSLILELDSIMKSVEKVDDPSEKLQGIILSTVQFARDNMDYWKLYVSFMMQPSSLEYSNIFTSNYFQEFFEFFEKIFKNTGVSNPKLEAYEYAAILDGLSFHLLFMEESYPLKEMKEHLLKKYSKNELLKR